MKQKGFTLIELLVVIAIIGVLSTLAVLAVNIARSKAKTAKVQHDLDQVSKAIGMLASETEQWPGHQEINTVCNSLPGGCPANNELCGVDANNDSCLHSLADSASGLIQDDGASPYPGWDGPYINNIPLDPWGYEYFLDTDYSVNIDDEPCNGGVGCLNVVVVGSYGPDGIGLNDYNADDIIKIIWR